MKREAVSEDDWFACLGVLSVSLPTCLLTSVPVLQDALMPRRFWVCGVSSVALFSLHDSLNHLLAQLLLLCYFNLPFRLYTQTWLCTVRTEIIILLTADHCVYVYVCVWVRVCTCQHACVCVLVLLLRFLISARRMTWWLIRLQGTRGWQNVFISLAHLK